MNTALIRSSLIAFATVFALTPAFAKGKKVQEESQGAAIAVVNGKAIPTARGDALIAGQIAQGQPDTPELRAAVREELIRREVLVQAAQKQGIDKKADVQTQVEMARQQVVIGAYLQKFVQANPVTDAQIKQEYEAIKAQLGDKEYKARHILVEKEADAKAIIEKLGKGEKFEDLAKQSKDPGSKDRGGELGWAAKASYVPAFSAAMVALDKGAYTKTPVKTDFGWHVIQLDDTRDLKLPTLEEAKPQIINRLQQKMVEQQVKTLREKAKVQ